jgi:hypothetical protein
VLGLPIAYEGNPSEEPHPINLRRLLLNTRDRFSPFTICLFFLSSEDMKVDDGVSVTPQYLALLALASD